MRQEKAICIVPLQWTIILVLLAVWLLGLLSHIGGGLVHLLLAAAVLVYVYSLLRHKPAH